MRKYELRSTTTWNGLPYIYDSIEGDDFKDGQEWYLADEADAAFNAALAAKDKRIAELEAENAELKRFNDTVCARLDAEVCDNDQLRAERVSDEILDDYIHIIKYGFGCRKLHQIGRDEAQAILNLRRANVKRDGEDAS